MKDENGIRRIADGCRSFFVDNQSQLIFLGFVATAFAAISTIHLRGDLYGDEWGHTWPLVGAADFWSRLRDHGAFYPPLYFVLAKGAVMAVGSPWAIRLPSLIFALATVLMAPFAARSIWGTKAFPIAALMVGTSPFVLEFAVEGRAYAQLIFFSLALVWAYSCFLRKETWSSGVSLTLAALGGCWSHYLFVLLPLVAGTHYVVIRRRINRTSLAVGIWAILGMLPLAFWKMGAVMEEVAQNLQSNWTEAYFHVPNFLARLTVALNFGYNVFNLPPLDPARNVGWAVLLDNWLPAALMAVALPGVGWAIFRLIQRDSHGRMMLWMVAGPVLISVVMSLAGGFLVREKHLAIVWGPLCLLLVPSVLWLWPLRAGKVVVFCYLTVCLIANVHFFCSADQYSRRMNWEGLVETLQKEVRPGDGVVVYNLGIASLSLRPSFVLRSGDAEIRLKSERLKGEAFPEIARRLDERVSGSIFLVVNETDRLLVDPGNQFLPCLKGERSGNMRMFGRNLILWRFAPDRRPTPR